ncbi:UPF0389 protein CG9231-like [Ornithodoros turicata]|uniref:UPF0389 protein CG9231-like n=1 Tax=Ornithodoros turicata TaxID=34597 RepID=UPI003138C223
MAATRSLVSAVSRRSGALRLCLARCYSQEPPKGTDLTHHRTNAFEKVILVYYKKYPKGQVPDFVPQGVMEKTRNLFRIQLNIVLTILTLLAALGFARKGRSEAHRGESLMKMNLEWHEEERRKHEEQNRAKAAT